MKPAYLPAAGLLLTMVWMQPACTSSADLLADANGFSDGPTDGAGDGDGEGDRPGDAGGDAPDLACGQKDAATLALWTFEGDLDSEVRDQAGGHHGGMRGSTWQHTPGPSGCGQAVMFTFTGNEDDITYVDVPDSPDWQLASGSIDVWIRLDPATTGDGSQGILARDAGNWVQPGHVSLYRKVPGNEIGLRFQRVGEGYATQTAPIEEGEWHRIAVNFGPPGVELFLDSVLQTEGAAWGIDGNTNPWSIGAGNWYSEEGASTPISDPFEGSLDDVRISRVRRAYQAGP
jgi:hypothetical protein